MKKRKRIGGTTKSGTAYSASVSQDAPKDAIEAIESVVDAIAKQFERNQQSKGKRAMSTKSPVKSVRMLLKDGEYAGEQSGYTVRFWIDDHKYEAETVVGVRGLRVPCHVKVENGEIVDITHG